MSAAETAETLFDAPPLGEQERMVEAILFASAEALTLAQIGERMPHGSDAGAAGGGPRRGRAGAGPRPLLHGPRGHDDPAEPAVLDVLVADVLLARRRPLVRRP